MKSGISRKSVDIPFLTLSPIDHISLVERRGYRAPPGIQFLIDVSRLEE